MLSSSKGLATWEYLWTPSNCPHETTLEISYQAFVSLETRQLAAVQLSVSSNSSVEIGITDILDQRSANRTSTTRPQYFPGDQAILTSVVPVGLENVTAAYVYSTVSSDLPSLIHSPVFDNSSTSQRYTILLDPISKATATFYKFVGVASTDHFADARNVAIQTAKAALSRGWASLLAAHTSQVASLMNTDFLADFREPSTGTLSQDDTIQSLQITAISSAYYLYTSLLPYNLSNAAFANSTGNSLPVSGLISDSYGGKIFWDADLFMAPPVMGTHPRLARQFSTYRTNRAAMASSNTVRHGLAQGSMLYPWTSGRYGQCYNTTAPCVMYEYHLNADIALSFVMAANTSGDKDWFDSIAAPVIDGIATGLTEVMTYSPQNGTWGIEVMTDADEYYMFVSDGSFTDSAISVVVEIAGNLRRAAGRALGDNWMNITEHPAIPTSDEGIVLEFRDMWNDLVSKQADVILMDYPFDFRRNLTLEKRSLAMDYYSVRQDPNGPAMTYASYAISANSLADSGCAFWTFLVKSFEPYVRAPWYQFSEQQNDDPASNGGATPTDSAFFSGGINPAFPFLTGHGGLLQVMTAGFLGMRVTDTNLVMNPSLPPQLEHFKAPIQFYNGAVVDCRMNRTHTTIKRRDASGFDGLVADQYGSALMPITIGHTADDVDGYKVYLAVGDTVVIANRQYDDTLTQAGNTIQCRSASSTDAYIHGQFPLAATDGYAGTSWQPVTSETASLVVDMSSIDPVELDSIFLDFGMRPPTSIKVLLSNSSSFDSTTVVIAASAQINITRPWDPNSPVVRYVGNTTSIAVEKGVWTGQYAKLTVDGCWAGDGSGATVAQFALVKKNSSEIVRIDPLLQHEEL